MRETKCLDVQREKLQGIEMAKDGTISVKGFGTFFYVSETGADAEQIAAKTEIALHPKVQLTEVPEPPPTAMWTKETGSNNVSETTRSR